ncbi:MAG: PAS domain S-box protein [Oligoflexia bacterium]|nr:PAS domain S-box protein [Oligoflexia bacterium]
MGKENSIARFDVHICSSQNNHGIMQTQIPRLEKLGFFNTGPSKYVTRIYITGTLDAGDLENLKPKDEYHLIIVLMNSFNKDALLSAVNKGVKGIFEISTPDDELKNGIISVIEHHGLATKHLDFYQRLVEMFPDMLHSVNPEGKIVWCNQKATELLGYSKDELIGKHIFDIYSPKVKEALSMGFSKLRDEGELVVNDSLVRSKSGEDIDVEVRSFSQYDHLGYFSNTASILRDIRERINFEKQKIQTTKMAALGELSASLAHDMSNPIMTLQLFTELIDEECNRPELKAHVKNMQATVAVLGKLIQHMKDYARESFKKRKEPVQLTQALDNSFILLTKKLTTNNVAVINEYSDKSITVLGDIIQLEQVFMNLLSNSCDVLAGRRDGVIGIKTYEEAIDGTNSAVIEISDNGSGIPAEHHEKIFSTFFTTKKEGKGTGLGLSTAASIVANHKGSISIKKSDSTGTTFKICLPITENL